MKFEPREETAAPVHLQIERYLQRELQSGGLVQGQRLPPNSTLAREWGVSCSDVQKAMARLTAAGLLDRAPRRGTFVKGGTDRAVIGILSKQNLSAETAHFTRALAQNLQLQMGERNWFGRVYDGLQETKSPGSPSMRLSYQHLGQDLLHYGFRGLIELNADLKYPDSLKPHAELPRVRYGVQARHPDVAVDTYQFAWESVKFLAERGRKRVLYLRTQPVLRENTTDLDGLYDAVREFSLPRPEVTQLEPLADAQSGYLLELNAYQKTRELLGKWQARRNGVSMPEAILVSDDVATRGVALALVQQGVKVPAQVTVVTQASEGTNLHYGIPVARYELLPTEIARQLLAILWKRMVAESLPSLPVVVPGRMKVEEDH